MPSLDDPGVDDGKIDFSKALEVGVIGAQHAHHLSALIADLLQRARNDPLDLPQRDHAVSPSNRVPMSARPKYASYHLTVFASPASRPNSGVQLSSVRARVLSSHCSQISCLPVLSTTASRSGRPAASNVLWQISRTVIGRFSLKLYARPRSPGR